MDAMVVLCDSWLWRMPLVDANDGCGEEAGDCLGALQSWRVEEEDIVRAEEVEAIASEPLFQAIILINCPMKDSSWVHQGQNVAQVPFLFFGVRMYVT